VRVHVARLLHEPIGAACVARVDLSPRGKAPHTTCRHARAWDGLDVHRALLAVTLAAILAPAAIAGPPIDGPERAERAPPPTRSFEPPAPLSEPETTTRAPKTWEASHEWEERATLIGLLGGAAVGAGSAVAFTMMLPESTNPPPEEARAMGVASLAMVGGAMGAYAGGLLGAGVGMVIDASQ
jgi:hypothetical protein